MTTPSQTYSKPMDLRAIPKVELHCHLELCFRHSTLIEVGKTLGIDVPEDREIFRKKWLITEQGTLASFLEKIMLIQAFWNSPELIERLTFEAAEDAHSQGVKIMEFRYAPSFIQIHRPHLSFEKIHESILKGVHRAGQLDMALGLIGIIIRSMTMEEAERATDFIIGNKDTFIGMDLADKEEGFDCKPFAPLFQRAKEAGLGITVHSAEENFPGAAELVHHAVELLGADRIGHGVQIHNSPEMIQYVIDKGIPLELCPTSNWLTHAVETKESHPFRKLMEAGVQTTLNSDDPSMFGIELLDEYALLRDSFHFTREEFDRCNDIAARHSFISLEEKQRVWPRPITK